MAILIKADVTREQAQVWNAKYMKFLRARRAWVEKNRERKNGRTKKAEEEAPTVSPIAHRYLERSFRPVSGLISGLRLIHGLPMQKHSGMCVDG